MTTDTANPTGLATAARRLAVAGGTVAVARIPPTLVRRLPSRPRARLQLLMNRALKRHPRTFDGARTQLGFTVDGVTSDLIQRYLYIFGVWEPDLTAWTRAHLRPGDVVVDVGANVGYFSLLAATVVGPEGRVVAFEPVPSIAELLERNVRRNGVAVEVHRAAVSDRPGELEVFRSADTNLGRSSTFGQPGSSSEGTVPAVRGADAIAEELWGRIRLVKIDVEGDEERALRGLAPVLAAMPEGAAVVVEITPDDLAARGGSAREVLAFMRGFGFTASALPNSYAAVDYSAWTPRPLVPLHDVPARQTDVIFRKERP